MVYLLAAVTCIPVRTLLAARKPPTRLILYWVGLVLRDFENPLVLLPIRQAQQAGFPRCLLMPLEVADVCVHGGITLPYETRRPDVYGSTAASGS